MILLYNPKSNPTGKPILPKAVLALGAMLEGRFDYRIFDGNLLDDSFTTLSTAIMENNADILAMTAMPGPQITEAAPLSKALKEQFPDLTIIWGGYFPTLHPEPVLKSGYVDYAFRGHSEISFLKFIEGLDSGSADLSLPGLAWREKDGDEIRLNPMPAVPDLNELPTFPYEQLDMARYLRPTFLGSRTISHHSSYGCPFRCNFCAVVNMVNGRFSEEKAGRTASVIDRLVHQYGANAIEFHDNNFFVNEARISEFCERIAHHGIQWWGFGRIDTLMKFSDNTWTAMKKSGLKMIFMGAEAGSDETLRLMNKGGKQTANLTLALAERMTHFDIVPEMSFIFGVPPDPQGNIEETIQFIRKVKRVNPATEIVPYIYTPVPLAGNLYDLAKESGFAFPDSLDEWIDDRWLDFVMHRTADLPWLDRRFKQRVRDFQIVLNSRYPTVTDVDMGKIKRGLLKALGGWRYGLRLYGRPIELRAFHHFFPYQRPETSGF